jgi:hypothetical protein
VVLLSDLVYINIRNWGKSTLNINIFILEPSDPSEQIHHCQYSDCLWAGQPGQQQQASHIYSNNTKTILKPIWTYGIQLWGTASTSNIEILNHFESKALRMIVDAPWYVPNTVSEGISKYQQLKKKPAATALNTVIASAHIQMT